MLSLSLCDLLVDVLGDMLLIICYYELFSTHRFLVSWHLFMASHHLLLNCLFERGKVTGCIHLLPLAFKSFHRNRFFQSLCLRSVSNQPVALKLWLVTAVLLSSCLHNHRVLINAKKPFLFFCKSVTVSIYGAAWGFEGKFYPPLMSFLSIKSSALLNGHLRGVDYLTSTPVRLVNCIGCINLWRWGFFHLGYLFILHFYLLMIN